MKIAVLKATEAGESRVAATPETVKKFIAGGASIDVESGAGAGSAISDAEYETAGATIAKTAKDALKDAAIVLAVRRPEKLTDFPKGAAVVALMDPHGNEKALAALAKAGLSALSLELIPRITRAQVMDVLSSQANLAGYQAVIEAAEHYGRAMPMMMTAAGTVPPAKVFIMGAGVAGLQAIATAKRLGAVVTATDVRPATKEQVESLGGKFLTVDEEMEKDAETAGGYAKEMPPEYFEKQKQVVADHIAKQDIVVTTALIPGKPAPVLVTEEMVKSMRPGSVIVDLAVEAGGNCPLSEAGKVVVKNGVKLVGHTNVPGRLASDASALFARNLLNFLSPHVDKDAKTLNFDWEDETVKGTLLTRDGNVVNPMLTGEGN